MPGFFDLDSPDDLLQKVGRELDRLREAPDDSDHAFNFFVTAEHMHDWLYPGNDREPERRTHRGTSTLLKVTWDIASGAKHFIMSDIHKSVRETRHYGGFWAKGFWAPGYWAKGMFAEPRLIVELSPDEASDLGEEPSAVELAEQVFAYWSDWLGDA